MCLIIYRPEGVELDEEMLLAAGRQNSDGVGLMWCRDGVIHTRRSMDTTKVFKFMREAGSDIPIAIHFRFATHGTKTLDNCHPFRVTDDVYMMHNGVLPVYDKGKVLSDTATYARRVLRPVVEGRTELFDDPAFRMLVEMSAGSSNKFLFMKNDGATGEYFWANEGLGTWRDKVWYSSGMYARAGYTGYTRTSYTPTSRAALPAATVPTTASTEAQTSYIDGEYEETDWTAYQAGHQAGRDAKRKARDHTVGGSEDTAPFAGNPVEGTSTDDAVNQEKQYEAWVIANRQALRGDTSESLADQLAEARALADQYAGSLLIPDEELREMLREEYGYDMDADRLVTMGASALG